jgi:hypothetical protein
MNLMAQEIDPEKDSTAQGAQAFLHEPGNRTISTLFNERRSTSTRWKERD